MNPSLSSKARSLLSVAALGANRDKNALVRRFLVGVLLGAAGAASSACSSASSGGGNEIGRDSKRAPLPSGLASFVAAVALGEAIDRTLER